MKVLSLIKLNYTEIMVNNKPFSDINEKIFDNIKKNYSIRKILADLKPEEYNEHMMIFSILNVNNILTFEGERFTYEFSRSQRYYC